MKQKAGKPPVRHIVKSRQTADFTLSESIYPPLLKQPRHTHDAASFSFILSGNYLENLDRRAHRRRASTVVFHPPHESHAVDYGDEKVRILSVQLSFEKLDYINRYSIALDSSASCRTEKVNYLGHRIYQEFRQRDSISALAIEGLVFEILAEAIRSRATAGEKNFPHWLEQTRNFLNDNFADSFVLEDLAKIAGVHPVHLSRVFREKFHCTIGEYVRRLRVEFASRQISLTDLPFCEIAQAAGFSDQSHLNRTFKSIFGVTPSEHRKITSQR